MLPQGRVMVRLEFAEKGDFYQVATAGPLRPQYYNKKRPLWERAQSNHSPKGTPDAISGQSGMRQDAVDNISLGIGNREVNGAPRARVAFDAAEGGRAVNEFFSGTGTGQGADRAGSDDDAGGEGEEAGACQPRKKRLQQGKRRRTFQ